MRQAETIGFAIHVEDRPRLDRLVAKHARGNRSAFLRYAIERIESFDRAAELASLQAYGMAKSAQLGITSEEELDEIVARAIHSTEDDG